jgi:hypothetical protein
MAEKFLGYNRGLHSGAYTVEGSLSGKDLAQSWKDLNDQRRKLTELDLSLSEKGGQAIDKWDKYLVDMATVEVNLQKAKLSALADGNRAAADAFGDKIQLVKEMQVSERANGEFVKAARARVVPTLNNAITNYIWTLDQYANTPGTGEVESMKPEEFQSGEGSLGALLDKAILDARGELTGLATTEGAVQAGGVVMAVQETDAMVKGVLHEIAKRNPALAPQIALKEKHWSSLVVDVVPSDVQEAYQRDKTDADARRNQFLDMQVAGISSATINRLAQGIDSPEYAGFSWDRAAQSGEVQRIQADIQSQRLALDEQQAVIEEEAESTLDPMSRTIRQYEKAFGANFDAYVAAMNFKGSDRERKQRAIMHFVDKPDQFNRFVAVAESTPTANVDDMRAALEQQGVTTSRFARGLVGATRRTPATPSPPTAASKVDGADSPPGPTAGPPTQPEGMDDPKIVPTAEAAPADDLAHRTGPNGGGKGSIFTEQAAGYKQRGTDLKAKQQELLAQLARKRDTEVA